MTNFLQKPLPVADWVENFTEWVTNTFSGFFSVIQSGGQSLIDGVISVLNFVPPLLFIAVLTVIAYFISNRKWGLTSFTLIGLLFIYNQGLWTDLMSTLTLVLLASLLSVIIGVPLGIWMAKSDLAQKIISPILDFMQTMPGFVYLIPAVAFFGIGMVPGVFASIIFALPPTVRFTNLGIRQIPEELVEASDSFGSTPRQKLFGIELPLAKNTILAGVNQTVMLALSMVVIASMIGAPGLGRGVLSALQRAQVGNGFVNGLALVILAIIIDRFTQYLNKPKRKAKTGQKSPMKKWVIPAAVVAALAAGIGFFALGNKEDDQKTINLAYVEWDTEVASTHVLGQVFKDMGYKVTMTPLDNAIMWESISKGEADATVSAWLPNTHKAQYDQYKDSLDDLGPNLKGAKLGLVVPSYMNVNSIEDLKGEANKTITGIEPGAGVMNAAEKTLKSYPNLSDWNLLSSSSGAMTVALGQALKNKEEIVITGWTPHWMFAKYDLKFLEDPKKTMGDDESIHTIARLGLKDDKKDAYKILGNFKWTKDDMESVMLEINNGTSPDQAAKNWIKNNSDKVAEWTK
ncbi:ABC transporter permease/substrate binding protein [Floricoccus penangensis]|uniref:ABC transporter permease/substrate binding protein n=1 Tax=Floricoccus penangensis TaxID=1859475 RepID=UPI00203AD336|nr:ABC transporter permease/substrate binding protein [Floricoccus penangensis]URZ87588.1 ABC transporter permease/substrate binding protein [Floricoccus penangensis]